ncbi:sporulation protein YqfD [Shouchella shacheensis]|uniref:sporulation protein YqfD n=1 Tax=Shouchella shacheensis TaxID=1649580 RepID=UPI000740147E|nr:sporulation protein YqfD [Shouchella shacheensis]
MRNDYLVGMQGYVRVEIEGRYPEQVLNACMKQNIHIWNVSHVEANKLRFYVQLKAVKELKPILKQTECKVRFKERRGVPFFLRKMGTRSGFAVGLLLFLGLMLMAANMVWGIQVKGASPSVEEELRKHVDEMGIKPGAFRFSLPAPDEVQRLITEEIDEATWIGVRKKGTTFEFEVVEQVRQEREELLSPRDLVASKKAVIQQMFVEDGHAVKNQNDFVEKGDVLVSGHIGREGHEQTVAAKATVIGEVWYTSTVSVPFENTFTSMTGEQKTKRMLSVGGFDLPFWGFRDPGYEESETFESETDAHLFGYRLPLQLKKAEERETLSFTRTYTEEEAINVAKERAREELKGKLPDDAEIKSEHILQEAVEHDKVQVRIHYQVLEEITEEKPIIQGD